MVLTTLELEVSAHTWSVDCNLPVLTAAMCALRPQMHSMLAFEFAGGWSDFKGSIAVTVLQFLLGGGGSFSSGGPGTALCYY